MLTSNHYPTATGPKCLKVHFVFERPKNVLLLLILLVRVLGGLIIPPHPYHIPKNPILNIAFTTQ